MDEKNALGEKFVIEDMDATHLFVAAKVIKTLEAKLWELMDKLSFPVGDGQWSRTNVVLDIEGQC